MNLSLISFTSFSTALAVLLAWRRKQRPSSPAVTIEKDNATYLQVTNEDMKYVGICRELMTNVPRPIHSNFLVVAVIVYEDNQGIVRYLTGVNSETCVLPSAICAERTALLQLRLSPYGYRTIRTIYITATAPGPISPGMLCREFMQEYTTPATRIFLFAPTFTALSIDTIPSSTVSTLEYDTRTGTYEIPADKTVCICSIGTLYPHPPLYHKIRRDNLLDCGQAIATTMVPFTTTSARLGLQQSSRLSSLGIDPSTLIEPLLHLYTRIRTLAAEITPADQLYPLHRAAGILFSDGTSVLCREQKCLEYGCTRDAIVGLSHLLTMKSTADSMNNAKNTVYPIVLLQTDQFGICTAPAAAPRAWLHEYGYDSVIVPVHTRTGEDKSTKHDLIFTSIAALSPASPAITLSAASVQP